MSAPNSSSTSTDLKSTLRGIKGVGDAIRGTAMEAVDSLSHNPQDKASEAQHHAIAERGMAEARQADQRFGERRAERNENLGGASAASSAGAGTAGGLAAANSGVSAHSATTTGHGTGAVAHAGAGQGSAVAGGVGGGHEGGVHGHGQAPAGAHAGSSSITNSKIAHAGQGQPGSGPNY